MGPARAKAETFVALKAEIETWRWAGVPFFLRTGKRLGDRLAQIVINFREVPTSTFGKNTQPNRLVIQLQPAESVRLYMMAKEPGKDRLREVYLDLDFKEAMSNATGSGLTGGLSAQKSSTSSNECCANPEHPIFQGDPVVSCGLSVLW